MPRTDFKSLPLFIRWLIRPALYLSLGLHALVLLVPIAFNASQEDATEPDDLQVTIAPPIADSAPSPHPSISPPASSPPPSPTPLPSSPPSQRPSPGTISSIPLPAPVPAAPATPAPQPQPSAADSTPTPTSLSSPEAPGFSPSPLPAPQNRVTLPFADFPHLAGAESGCLGTQDCRQVSSNPREAGQILVEQLNAQGYRVERRDDLEETGRLVYEVMKDDFRRYLSVISLDLGETAYILAAEPLTQTDIEQAGSIQAELETVLNTFSGGKTATYAQFAFPESFFTGTTPYPEAKAFYLLNDSNAAQLPDALVNQLQSSGFTLSQVGEYGGGAVYEVSRKAYIGYLSFSPTQDNQGTIAVLWSSLPE